MAGTASISWIENTASATYAKWNSADKDADITLSGGDLVASNSNGNSGMVRSTIGKSSGKWYWEVTLTVIDNSSWDTGIANASATLTTYPGFDANGWAYWFNTGDKLTNNSLTAYSTTPSNGDVIGVALDMDAGTIKFLRNNTDLGVAFSGLSGTIYAAVGNNNSLFTATANFGASTMAYTAPVGYNQGLYN